VVTEIIQTTGDRKSDMPFAQVGTKGMFVKEIEQALLQGTIDLGVHSLKDMPSELPEGLTLACVPEREEPYDALISRVGALLDELPAGAVVGTSSLRRQAQLRFHRPDLRLEELRGNLDTRLRKLDEGQYDAIVLACAGLNRLGFAERITERIAPEICLPAAGQGALALETRADDTRAQRILAALHDPDSADAVEAERGFLAALGGGCTVPAGALAQVEGERVTVQTMLARPDGASRIWVAERGERTRAAEVGAEAARRLLANGGTALLKGLS
jgi:hydroxymethylbilane synthase